MSPTHDRQLPDHSEHRALRFRRHRRRAYIRSVYFLPSLATLGNALCGFGAIYIASLTAGPTTTDPLTRWLSEHSLSVAAYLIFLAMLFDAIDGRLARFARHTTEFGGQLDSLADVVSFGAAPAFMSLYVSHSVTATAPHFVTRMIFATAALYFCCAAIRLARFNVSNEHGEQHHFSFLGLPSPAAGAVIASYVLMHEQLRLGDWVFLANAAAMVLPAVVLVTGLAMVSNLRYPHLVNRYLRGRRSLGRLLVAVAVLLLLFIKHEYTLALASMVYALLAPLGWLYRRGRPDPAASNASPNISPAEPGSSEDAS